MTWSKEQRPVPDDPTYVLSVNIAFPACARLRGPATQLRSHFHFASTRIDPAISDSDGRIEGGSVSEYTRHEVTGSPGPRRSKHWVIGTPVSCTQTLISAWAHRLPLSPNYAPYRAEGSAGVERCGGARRGTEVRLPTSQSLIMLKYRSSKRGHGIASIHHCRVEETGRRKRGSLGVARGILGASCVTTRSSGCTYSEWSTVPIPRLGSLGVAIAIFAAISRTSMLSIETPANEHLRQFAPQFACRPTNSIDETGPCKRTQNTHHDHQRQDSHWTRQDQISGLEHRNR